MVNPLNTTKSIRAQKQDMYRLQIKKKLKQDLEDFENYFQTNMTARSSPKVMLGERKIAKVPSAVRNLKTTQENPNLPKMPIKLPLTSTLNTISK